MNSIDQLGCFFEESPNFIIDRPEGSGNYLLLLFLTPISIMQDNQVIEHPAGTMILYTPDHPQYYFNRERGFVNDWLHFNTTDLNPLLAELGFPLNRPVALQDVTAIHQIFLEIEKEHHMKALGAAYKIDLMIAGLLIEISRRISHENPIMVHPLEREFRQLRSRILSRLNHPWTIDDLAGEMGLSRSRFTYLYKEIFLVSPKEDLLSARMKMAMHLLSVGSGNVTEIAAKVGYENLFHFSKQFKVRTGLSPSAYKQKKTAHTKA